MKIISLNAWGGAMFDSLVEWLPDCGADILCLQEVTRTNGLCGTTRFDDGERSLPQRANLYADVCATLPNHQGVFLTSDSGPVYDEIGNRHQQDFGISLFVHQRIPMVRTEVAFVHGAHVDHHEWPISDRPRVAHAARLFDRVSDRYVTIVHLHGLRDSAGKADSPSRISQAHRLADLTTRVRSKGDFVIVCGDLNLTPESETFRILANIGLVDLVGKSDTRTSKYKKPGRHANYMLVSNPERVIQFSIPSTPEVSDHRFLALEFQ